MSADNDHASPDPAWEGSGSAPVGASDHDDHEGGAGEGNSASSSEAIGQTEGRKIIALRPLAEPAWSDARMALARNAESLGRVDEK